MNQRSASASSALKSVKKGRMRAAYAIYGSSCISKITILRKSALLNKVQAAEDNQRESYSICDRNAVCHYCFQIYCLEPCKDTHSYGIDESRIWKDCHFM